MRQLTKDLNPPASTAEALADFAATLGKLIVAGPDGRIVQVIPTAGWSPDDALAVASDAADALAAAVCHALQGRVRASILRAASRA